MKTRENFVQSSCAWQMAGALLLLCTVTAIAAPAQIFTELLNFNGTNGAYPWAKLIQGTDGNLYGTTLNGGNLGCNPPKGCGTIFNITPAGKLTTVYSFNGADGASPHSALVLAIDGNFYGTTSQGGASDGGTAFKITSGGVLTTLHSFSGADGLSPMAELAQSSNGDFYGTTYSGGANGAGTVFKITPGGTFTTLHSFRLADGANPVAALVQATDGNLYGTTSAGGRTLCACGTVFKITLSGTLTVLHYFGGYREGAVPGAGLIQAADGYLYGTTNRGGCCGIGTIFKITLAGQLTKLFDCDISPHWCGWAVNTLTQGTDGNFYSTNGCCGRYGYGSVFEVTPDAVTELYGFDLTDGNDPQAGLLQSTGGKFYGSTAFGGHGNCDLYCGTLFRLDMGLGPFVSLVLQSGKVGDNAQILGQGFTDTIDVSFNGVPATFTVVSDTYLTATVPVGATTGPVTVTTPSGTLISNVPFRIVP